VKAKADPLRMNVHLGAELFAYAEEKARTGGYRSIAEVVRQALREMRDRDIAALREERRALKKDGG
jgi:putative addiction module CopG family antidote